ncbi:hypothetical protein ERJ75_000706600 [Trypanosoma vivax]|nr:hypothetical protein TRVL_00178 [Trypanosoma vivax]KAH8614259.1 hypothetical protein ERJ75_000706600 [Trypanosoma vivax]
MTVGSSEVHNYLGNIYCSLEYLPRYYQISVLILTFALFSIREIPLVGWLAMNMHSSFGTQVVWSEEYQRRLETMKFNERLYLTLYGMALLALAALAYVKFARNFLGMLVQESGLTGNNKWWPAAVICIMFACESVIILKEEAARKLSDSTSLAYLALKGFEGIERTPFDQRLKNSNPHSVIQMQILKAFVLAFVKRVGPSVAFAFLYRTVRDVSRKAHAALRWYIVTLMLSRSLIELYSMYQSGNFQQTSSWILLTSTAILLGMVNYTFGPSRRGGWTAATSYASSLQETARGLVKSAVMFFVIYLSILALVVSVHVVELMLIWLIFFLLTVWAPAIIDSCAVDYIICIAASISYIAHKMDRLTWWGSIHLFFLLSLWWLNLCIMYSLVTNLSRSRYGGVVAMFVAGASFWYATGGCEYSASGVPSYFNDSVATLSRLVEEPIIGEYGKIFLAGPLVNNARPPLVNAVLVLAGLVASTALVGIYQPRELQAYLAGQNIVLVTPNVLFRKLVKTLIFAICFLIFVAVGLFMYRLVPQLTMFVPDFIALGMAVGVACTTLGGLMGVQDHLYIAFMRLIGFVEPPEIMEEMESGPQHFS